MAGDPINEVEQKALLQLLHHGLVEIRHLGWQGKAEQAAALADAIESLPMEMAGVGIFQWSHLRRLLKKYQEKYPERFYDFVDELDKIHPPGGNSLWGRLIRGNKDGET